MPITEEDLKSMTPEQIAALQKQNCIFCQIISGKVASKKIYEDSKVTAVLDINPANPGHILLLPKEHYAVMPQIPDDEIAHLFMVSKAISHACLRTFKAQGTNIFIANGVAAGQKAQHFMIHIIPRKENDGITVLNIPHKKATEKQLGEVRKILKEKIKAAFGIKEELLDLDKIGKGEVGKEEKKEKGEEAEEKKIEEEKKEAAEEETKAKPKLEEEEVEAEFVEEKAEEEKEEEAEEKEEKEGIDLDKIAELLGNKIKK